MLDEGFVPFPKRLVRSLRHVFSGPDSMNQLQALLAIVDFRREQLSRLPSINFLAFIAGMETDEFRCAIHTLEKAGKVRISGSDEALDIDTLPVEMLVLSLTANDGVTSN